MLLGRDWLGEFRLDWRELHGVYSLQEGDLQRVLRKFLDVLNNELGTLKGVEAILFMYSQERSLSIINPGQCLWHCA